MDEKTKAVIREVAEEAANRAVARTLTSLGIDHENPIEVQRDLAALRELRGFIEDPEVQQDLMHLRRWRKAMESVQSKGLMTVAGLLVVGVCAMAVLGVKSWLGQ